MTNKKPQPLISRPIHDRCPVCGEITYSFGRIHPQCAVRQLDEVRLKKIKTEDHSSDPSDTSSTVRAWQKRCPHCKQAVHVRKKACSCGHIFAANVAPQNNITGLS